MKTCSVCRQNKPVDLFERDGRKPDGRGSRCRSCRRRQWKPDYGRAFRERNRDRERERDRARIPNRPTKVRDSFKEKARHAVRNAVAAGKLTKPEQCESCGAVGLIHAHHEDYTRPFEIEWLCGPCHGMRHRRALTDTEDTHD